MLDGTKSFKATCCFLPAGCKSTQRVQESWMNPEHQLWSGQLFSVEEVNGLSEGRLDLVPESP